jgi:phage gp16-like protein
MSLTPGQIALIHVAKKQLGMDDETYRAVLKRVAGVASSKNLNPNGLEALMAEFARLGFVGTQQRTPQKGAGAGSDENRPTKAQWALLGDLARKAGFTGFDDPRFIHWQKARSGVDHPRFLDMQGLNKLISALKNWTGRAAHGSGHHKKPAQ